ncbi:ABC transporter permease [Testudinibacter aquarius]|uniref:ABC transporter permease n=1 Tax=Testudinibacter aquarius TaxID=1524974 RepID=A0A4R3Y2S2_9PAST|nr:ABC transporter permease [Testudinibacter aquarius]KAE9529130.1 ribose ABC transporter permease [Testudinibacter aquarius]TCV84604.1 monosaccharide ABC transporter membrane protein (CUT2 family) [Testudinibacter aquarius]TNG92914.1 ABC transporter permease [Testudinibacter aquarius]
MIKNNRLTQYLRQLGGIFLALIILCVFFSLANNRFMSVANFMNILQQVSVVAIAAFGMTWVILLGEIDLSIGSIIAVSGMVAAQVLTLDYGLFTALFVTLCAGAMMGFINGTLTAKLALPSFIVTVATMGIYRGMVSLPTNGAPQMITNSDWTAIGNSALFGIPVVIWVLILLFLINHIVLSKTVFGRKAYLTGGNIEAAQYSGIQTARVKIWIFTLSGIMAAIAGILLSSRLYSAQTNAGMGYELDAIAAAVLGGTSLTGGVGTMIGTLVGALIIGILNNGMNMISVPYFYQLIVKGIVILVAVWLDVRAKKKRSKA